MSSLSLADLPWTTVAFYASWSLIVAGSVLSVISGIGMIRLPDLYTRIHAASVADTGGMMLILGGLMIQAGLGLVTIRIALIVLFLLITSPTATHALARAARQDEVMPKAGSDDRGDAPR